MKLKAKGNWIPAPQSTVYNPSVVWCVVWWASGTSTQPGDGCAILTRTASVASTRSHRPTSVKAHSVQVQTRIQTEVNTLGMPCVVRFRSNIDWRASAATVAKGLKGVAKRRNVDAAFNADDPKGERAGDCRASFSGEAGAGERKPQ
jgi:hypothetical protein